MTKGVSFSWGRGHDPPILNALVWTEPEFQTLLSPLLREMSPLTGTISGQCLATLLTCQKSKRSVPRSADSGNTCRIQPIFKPK